MADPWWFSGKESTCQCKRHGFNPWDGKIPWKKNRPPTPLFLPGKSHGRRSLVGCSPWGRCESDTTEQLHFWTFRLLSAVLSQHHFLGVKIAQLEFHHFH